MGFNAVADCGETLWACVQAVVINVDDFGARALSEELRATGARVVGYGEAADADVRLTDLDFEGTHASATLHAEGRSHRLKLQVPGRYNLANAAAAFAAEEIDLPEEIAAALDDVSAIDLGYPDHGWNQRGL